MDDQLDNDLRNRIREVFDNYEDTTADEGWQLLREKFPAQDKQRRPVYLWWAGVAAALLLFLSIGTWMFTNKKDPRTDGNLVAVKPAQPAQQQNNAADTVAAPLNAAGTNPAGTGKQAPAPNPAAAGAANSGLQNTIAKSTGANPKPANGLQGAAVPISPVILVQIPATGPGQQASLAKITTPQPIQSGNSNTALDKSATKKMDSVKSALPKTTEPQYAANPAATQPIADNGGVNRGNAVSNNTALSPVIVKPKPKINSMEALLASEDNAPEKIDNSVQESRVKFGVYAATFFNYAKGSQNQVNAGAGITSEIRLSKNLKLATGVAIAQNTLNYDKRQPENTRDAVSFSPVLTASYNNLAEFSKVSATPSFTNYNAKLVGLDIPLNIKYEFNPQKTDTYILAGVSSGTFVNEAYTASYSYPGLAQAAGVQQQPADETTHKSFNSFYVAKTLNLAFGVGYPVGKSNRIVIEPFFKYPLDGLGSQQIKFGAGGVNLKLNFTTHKK
ncbi:hypothetical protein LX99_00391 [Mucilaginibacter oryzae]|uniref:Outer membrane protein with beta-barrel domain n=1 Tax=Mucilaginibacter oryzae TaxID=468058 RepID=A0A316HIT9_9SPHI|nr:outer membrane beta-barrel protein [Mucilaginibacter oryzae]PWK79930.1 hypothetical protein LX99_00391 [Mucilaginibacter oryzae]